MKFVMPKMDKLLNDKNVLYVVLILAILNLLGYLVVQNTEAVVFFLIVGFLSTYFSKNMIIVLMIAIVSTSIFTSTRSRFVTEGMSSQRGQSKKVDETSKKQPVNENKNMKMNAAPEEMKEDQEPEGMTTVSNNAKKPNKLDYAGTLEKAYDNLQKTVGEGGIEGLTGQTKKLLDQQESLMKNIKGMEPFLATAESFMSKLDLEGLTGMFSKITGK